jgi:hypothetical protein
MWQERGIGPDDGDDGTPLVGLLGDEVAVDDPGRGVEVVLGSNRARFA